MPRRASIEGSRPAEHGLAQGLVMANRDQSSSKYGIRYVAVTTDDALSRRGIRRSQTKLPRVAGRIVLAEGVYPSWLPPRPS